MSKLQYEPALKTIFIFLLFLSSAFAEESVVEKKNRISLGVGLPPFIFVISSGANAAIEYEREINESLSFFILPRIVGHSNLLGHSSGQLFGREVVPGLKYDFSIGEKHFKALAGFGVGSGRLETWEVVGGSSRHINKIVFYRVAVIGAEFQRHFANENFFASVGGIVSFVFVSKRELPEDVTSYQTPAPVVQVKLGLLF